MVDDMVLRSVYLTGKQDDQLGQLARKTGASRSDLIRAAFPSFFDMIYTPGVPDMELQRAIRSTKAALSLKQKLGVYRTLSRSIPKRQSRAKALVV